MSTVNVQHRPAKVKCFRKRFDRFANPDPAEISDLWRELRTLADVVPPGERAGVARARTRLLADVPSWRLPEVLDSLAAGGASA
jgi:hypothetical protein